MAFITCCSLICCRLSRHNIELTAAENTSTSDTVTSSKSSGYGVDLNPSGAVTGLYASSSKSSGTENTDATTHTETQITAQNTLTIKSGQDTSLTGAQVQGDSVVATIGGNLTLESQQDTDNYRANKTSTDGRIDIGLDVSVDGVDGSMTKNKTDSTYSSVVEQTSISAGTGGFDITIVSNTDLKGAVIVSTADADKNKLTTDTLTYSNLENKAEYSASSVGVNIDTSADAKLNEKGITPNIGMPASGDAQSTTQSAISAATI
ncbi:hemagglutinin repeat-containing protein [Pelosinus propionicus]|uniref:Haemagluttinin repeat-containing protein n=1 Tax=Pelosinus propionicus DSM 13327 TaxID=1123291 RepID=A0A1I4NYE5_9FIRM|nr:hemagglutinin repeat-containing protein [Pelosinus propionicus]SFM20425.1 Haemagluttinin repeat-containing protein [Pelosinus propionicus DSM 13327]